MFDSFSTEAKQTFDKDWEKEKRVVTQIATEETLAFCEKNDTGSKLIYIGDKTNIKERIEFNKGIFFSSTDFIKISQVMRLASFSTNLQQDKDMINWFRNRERKISGRIKRLKYLGIRLKISK